jgi:hypothetical protein
LPPASYVVVRYIADPARNEPLNIGILAWVGQHHVLEIDDDAVARVIRDHPRLHRDALLSIRSVVEREFGLEENPPGPEIAERVSQQRGFPVLLTEPRFTTAQDETRAALLSTVVRLLDRVVRPRRRHGGVPMNIRRALEARLAPWVTGGQIEQHHVFDATRSGVVRRVDYYLNSGTNIAVDTLILDLVRSDEILLRADAEANKVRDVAERNDTKFLVVASVSDEADVADATHQARQILTAESAELITSVDRAIAEIGRSVRHTGRTRGIFAGG